MNKFIGKHSLSQLIMLGTISLGLTGCTQALNGLFCAPDPHSQAEAPLESRTPAQNTDADAPTPPPQENTGITEQTTTQAEVRSLLTAWRDAWVKQDVPTYLSFYVDSFKGHDATPENWRSNRKRIISQAKQIEVSIGEPNIVIKKSDRATVTFNQEYRTSNKSDTGRKTLQLHRIDGRWLIEQETFSATSK